MTRDALFRIHSMSKPITAVAAMMLYEEGEFALSDPVANFVPELADLDVLVDGELVPAERTMTMRHLLTHTAGLSYGADPRGNPVDAKYVEAQPFLARNLDGFAERLGTLPLMFEPGERWHYSFAVDVTGLIVQRLSGMPFDLFLKQRLFQPLGMEDTFFNVPADKLDRLMPIHRWNREEGRLAQIEEPYEDTELPGIDKRTSPARTGDERTSRIAGKVLTERACRIGIGCDGFHGVSKRRGFCNYSGRR